MAHLLVVDDDPDITEVLGALLRLDGHIVQIASNGEEGLRMLRAAPLPDVLVLDVDMPVTGGPEMAHQMLLHDAGEQMIPILLMSANRDLAQVAERMGTPYFLTKGADIGAFLVMVERAILERRPPTSA